MRTAHTDAQQIKLKFVEKFLRNIVEFLVATYTFESLALFYARQD